MNHSKGIFKPPERKKKEKTHFHSPRPTLCSTPLFLSSPSLDLSPSVSLTFPLALALGTSVSFSVSLVFLCLSFTFSFEIRDKLGPQGMASHRGLGTGHS